LIYERPLPAESRSDTRAKEKQEIRRQLHPQLREYWRWHPQLNFSENYGPGVAANYERFGFKFLPLITKANGLACALDILFLRRDMPGGLVKYGGDLDNRMKTFMDGLRIPDTREELAGDTPTDDTKDIFYCLMDTDALITEVNIASDLKLRPITDRVNDVVIVMNVWVKIVRYVPFSPGTGHRVPGGARSSARAAQVEVSYGRISAPECR